MRIGDQRERADRLRTLVEAVEAQVARDENLLAELAGLLGVAPQLRLESLDPRLRGQRLQEVAIDLLRTRDDPLEPVHYREWYELLVAAGHRIAGKDPLATFLAQINRATPVERIGNRSGLYRLRAA